MLLKIFFTVSIILVVSVGFIKAISEIEDERDDNMGLNILNIILPIIATTCLLSLPILGLIFIWTTNF